MSRQHCGGRTVSHVVCLTRNSLTFWMQESWLLLMASTLHDVCSLEFAPHHLTLTRRFFDAWQQRNERRQYLWQEASVFNDRELNQSPQIHFSSLHKKIQHLKEEIIGLMAQDTALFQQLFALQEAMLDFREQIAYESDHTSSSDEISSSPYMSPSSTLSTSSVQETDNTVTRNESSGSFVRHRVSYPPIARNRSRRIKSPPSHGCQDSYDSGIHTSDLEIFV